MTNEYLEEFEKLKEKSTFRGQQWFGQRQHLVEVYSWAIPSEEVVAYLAEFDEIVEIGAGSGYWATCINEADGKTMPYDVDPPSDTWTHVERKGVLDMREDAFTYPVLMVWPPCDNQMASLVAGQEPPHILYVGEQRGGCTADGDFFNQLDKHYGLVAKMDIPSYAGINDSFYHYVRKL